MISLAGSDTPLPFLPNWPASAFLRATIYLTFSPMLNPDAACPKLDLSL